MPFFDIFASPRWSPLRMRTKVASFFIFFQELSNKKKIKALRPKMTKIASRGGSCLKVLEGEFVTPVFLLLTICVCRYEPCQPMMGTKHQMNEHSTCIGECVPDSLCRAMLSLGLLLTVCAGQCFPCGSVGSLCRAILSLWLLHLLWS